jgi:hypothetical protein
MFDLNFVLWVMKRWNPQLIGGTVYTEDNVPPHPFSSYFQMMKRKMEVIQLDTSIGDIFLTILKDEVVVWHKQSRHYTGIYSRVDKDVARKWCRNFEYEVQKRLV